MYLIIMFDVTLHLIKAQKDSLLYSKSLKLPENDSLSNKLKVNDINCLHQAENSQYEDSQVKHKK